MTVLMIDGPDHTYHHTETKQKQKEMHFFGGVVVDEEEEEEENKTTMGWNGEGGFFFFGVSSATNMTHADTSENTMETKERKKRTTSWVCGRATSVF